MAANEHAKYWFVSLALVCASAVPAWAQPAELPPTPEEPAPEAPSEPGAVSEVSAEPGAVGEVTAEPDPSMTAEAEAVAEPEAASGSKEDEDIVVTGSRLKRTSFDAPSPVTVVDRGAIAKTGATSMRDIVANMPSNNGAENNTGIGTGARGSAQFNLRGLGAGTTLVLLNGRRLLRASVSADGQPFDNVASIPLPLVERIEVMKGGASAIYGSDAVSGVVNIITRRKYNGVDLQLSGNMATRGGGLRDGEAALTMGTSNDTSGIGLMVSYYDRTGLSAVDRPNAYGRPGLQTWNRANQVPITAPVMQADGTFRPMPWPDGYAYPTNLSGSGNPSGFTFIYPAPMGGMAPPPKTFPDPNCLSPQALAAGSFQRQVSANTTNCGFDFAKYYNYVLPEERLNIYSTMEHDFNEHLHAFAEAGFFRLHINSPNSPSYSLSKEIFIPTNHPDIPAELRAQADMASAIRIVGRTRGGDYPSQDLDTRHDNVRLVAGLKGDFGGVAGNSIFQDWDWEVSVTHQNSNEINRSNDDIAANLQRSIDACATTRTIVDPTNPAGGMVTIPNPDFGKIPCFHPFYSADYLSRNVYDRNNTLQQTAIEYVEGITITEAKSTMTVGDALLRGSLAHLAGGDLGIAIGAQVRHNTTRFLSDHDGQLRNYAFTVGTPAYAGSNNVFAGFAEIGVPFVRGIELQGALRYEHYSDVGGSLDPKIGLSLAPFVASGNKALTGLRARAAFATSFRGPSLLQTQGRQVSLTEFASGNSSVFRPAITNGNPGLTPERSTAITAGLEYAVAGLALEAEFWRYTYRSMVVKENDRNKWNGCYNDIIKNAPAGSDVRAMAAASTQCAGVDVTGDGQLNSVNVNFINAASVNTHGIDFGLNYRFGNADSVGIFALGGQASYLLSYKANGSATEPQLEYAGFRNITTFPPALPKLHATFPASWTIGGHSLQATGRLVGSFRDDETGNLLRDVKRLPDGTPDLSTGMAVVGNTIRGSGPVVPAWFTLDLQYSFRMEKVFGAATAFTIGALNVLDADPPFIQTNLGYEGSQHDPRGRMLYAKLNQTF